MSEIQVQPGADLQALSKNNPAGTVFRLAPGVYTGQSVTPKDDQQFLAAASGVVLDGAGKEFAFGGPLEGAGGKRVVLSGFTVQNYAPLARPPKIQYDYQGAVIRPFGYAHDWKLSYLTVRDNRHRGIQVDNGWHVVGCQVLRNGCLGIGGGGNPATLIEDCEIAGNNTEGHDSHNEGGGTKFVYSNGLTVKDCSVYENDGPGIWFDGHSTDAQIVGNAVYGNRGPGIDYEINAGALIEWNTFQNNGLDPNWADDYDLGGGGVLIIDCSGVIVRNNEILDNQGGVGLVDDARSGRDQWPKLENIEVSGNLIRYAARKHGVAIATGRPSLAGTVRFHDNQYTIDPARQGFRIAGANLRFAEWQSRWTGEQLADDSQEEQGMSQFGAIAGLSVTGVKGPAPVVKPGKPTPAAYRSIVWTAVPGADSYLAQRKVGEVWQVLTGPIFTFTDSASIDVPARGRYRVRAVNAAGVGPWSYLLV